MASVGHIQMTWRRTYEDNSFYDVAWGREEGAIPEEMTKPPSMRTQSIAKDPTAFAMMIFLQMEPMALKKLTKQLCIRKRMHRNAKNLHKHCKWDQRCDCAGGLRPADPSFRHPFGTACTPCLGKNRIFLMHCDNLPARGPTRLVPFKG